MEEIHQRIASGKALWKESLAGRQSTRQSPDDDARKEYRDQVLSDRARARAQLRPDCDARRHKRHAEVDNDTGLPPAKRSRLAADFEQWCRFNSWAICEYCGLAQPRDMQPPTFGRLLPPKIRQEVCSACQSLGRTVVPQPSDAPAELVGLGEEA